MCMNKTERPLPLNFLASLTRDNYDKQLSIESDCEVEEVKLFLQKGFFELASKSSSLVDPMASCYSSSLAQLTIHRNFHPTN